MIRVSTVLLRRQHQPLLATTGKDKTESRTYYSAERNATATTTTATTTVTTTAAAATTALLAE